MPRRPSSAISRSIGRIESGRARDVIEERQARARRDAGHDRVRPPRRATLSGKGIGATTTRARARSATNSSVFQHALYAWSVVSSSSSGPSGARAEDGVDAARRIGDEGEVVGCRAHEGGQRGPRGVEPVVELAGEEAHGLGLHLGPQGRLMPQHFRGAGPEGAVVQEGQAALERPERGVRRGRAHGRRRAVKPRCPRPGRGPGGGGAGAGCRPAPASPRAPADRSCS